MKRKIVISVVLVLTFATVAAARMGMMGNGMMDEMMKLMWWFRGGEVQVNPTPPPKVTPMLLREGRRVYETFCVACHGVRGDGKGRAAIYLRTKPRDFTTGVFKFRSTPSGSIPIDRDLFVTISKGIRGTAMLPWFNLTEREKWAVIAYIKRFSERFEEEEPDPPVEPPEADVSYARMLKRGKEVFESAKCWECHGREGHGDGPKAKRLKDDWGNPVWPRDYVHEKFKRGSNIDDIFMTVATGLDGTPMPSHIDSLPVEDILAVATYVNSLAEKGRFVSKGMGMMNTTDDERRGMRIYHMSGMRCGMM